jgi:hypothetical protein
MAMGAGHKQALKTLENGENTRWQELRRKLSGELVIGSHRIWSSTVSTIYLSMNFKSVKVSVGTLQ